MSFDYKHALKFEHNLSDKDKKMRLIAGSIALFISIFTASIILLLVGLVLVATGYSGWCPAFSGLHKNNCGDETAAVATEL